MPLLLGHPVCGVIATPQYTKFCCHLRIKHLFSIKMFELASLKRDVLQILHTKVKVTFSVDSLTPTGLCVIFLEYCCVFSHPFCNLLSRKNTENCFGKKW